MVSVVVSACQYEACSVPAIFQLIAKAGLGAWLRLIAPSWTHMFAVLAWIAFQVVLYVVLPGPVETGQPTPAGHVLSYRLNGWAAWFVSVGAFLLASAAGVIEPSAVSENWTQLVSCLSLLGLGLALFAYLKGKYAPTHPDDVKQTGDLAYDYFMGIELNPRLRIFGTDFDFKQFFNGRPGIIGWSIIMLSFAAHQYKTIGTVTPAMMVVNLLHNMYILDFFWNEGWYLRTIDIALDHFGFMLAWGDLTWLPAMYTIQGLWLSRLPETGLTGLPLWLTLALGVAGYALFRAANHQRAAFRANPQRQIWGRAPQFIEASYRTSDGKTRRSLLLCSHLWGGARHLNYLGDLMGSLAYCLTCGLSHPLPYFYIIYMIILLVFRTFRDEGKCKAKYGATWDEYMRLVPYRIVPYVW